MRKDNRDQKPLTKFYRKISIFGKYPYFDGKKSNQSILILIHNYIFSLYFVVKICE